jgi:hypothetical protein
VFDMLGEFGKAAEMFRGNVEALKLGPSDPRRSRFLSESQAWLTRVLGLLGEFVEGRYQGEEAVRLSTLAQGTSPILAHGGLGQLLLAHGDFAAAIPVLESGLALSLAADERAWGVTIAGALGESERADFVPLLSRPFGPCRGFDPSVSPGILHLHGSADSPTAACCNCLRGPRHCRKNPRALSPDRGSLIPPMAPCPRPLHPPSTWAGHTPRLSTRY